MKVFILCERIRDREGLHELLQKTLDFPPYYGKNLDALFDCLTDITKPTHVVLCEFYALHRTLGEYALDFLSVFEKAAEENLRFTYEFARKDCLLI